jgi:glucokinase
MWAVAAVDIGATHLRVAVGDQKGEVICRHSEPSTHEISNVALSRQVKECLSKLLKSERLSGVRRIGVATTGPLDRRGGIRDPANLPQVGYVSIARPLAEAFGSDVVLLNDCTAAALAEHEEGAGRGIRNLVYVTLSTGIGAGVFVDGHMLLGKDGNAHEVGHCVIDSDLKLQCGCGKRGHWEAYCSGRNMPKVAALVAKDPVVVARVASLTAADIFRLAKKGDRPCKEVVKRVGLLNAMGFANLVDFYDPELIVVGGSVALKNPREILGPIRRHLGEFSRNRLPRVELTELGEDIVLRGALFAAIRGDSIPELAPWTYRVTPDHSR